MEVSTDRWGLNRHKMFKLIREALPENCLKSKNLISFNNGVIYAYNANSLLTLNIKTLQSINDSEITYQVLSPSDPPLFEVNCIKINETGSLCALIGTQGISILEIPRRWGKFGLFQGGKDSIFCNCGALDARFLSCNGDIIRQARWHPASESNCQLVVLTSQNELRIYKTSSVDNMIISAVWSLGRSPVSVPYLASLGDVAVDFDFTPPQIKDPNPKALEFINLQWPILILFGNGDIYLLPDVPAHESKQAKPSVSGPLCMYPAADDNYGTDASSLLVLSTTPPIVVIAMNSGTVYHALLMSSTEDLNGKNDSFYEFNSSFSNRALYVFESIEFELGLTLNYDDQQLFSCPIFLHRDPILNSRYFCSHDTGINVINIPFTADLEVFAGVKDNEIDFCLPSFYHQSSSEYLLCTHVSNSTEYQPVLGLTIVDRPSTLIALLGSGEVISLSLASFNLSTDSQITLENKKESIKKSSKLTFDLHIKNLLSSRSTRSQPLLKLNANAKPSPQECLELITRVIWIFRKEHFPTYEMVKEEIKRRVRFLKNMKTKQVEEIKELDEKKAQLQVMAEKLADKYEECNEKQESLTKRAERVLMLISCIQPTSVQAEKKMSSDLLSIKEKLNKFKVSMEQIRTKQSYQQKNIVQNTNSNMAKRELYLSSMKEKTIKANLAEMTSEISDLVGKVSLLKTELNHLHKT